MHNCKFEIVHIFRFQQKTRKTQLSSARRSAPKFIIKAVPSCPEALAFKCWNLLHSEATVTLSRSKVSGQADQEVQFGPWLQLGSTFHENDPSCFQMLPVLRLLRTCGYVLQHKQIQDKTKRPSGPLMASRWLSSKCVFVCASQECVPPCSKLKHAMQNSHYTVVLPEHFEKLLFSQSLLCHFRRVSSHNASNSGLQTKSIWAHRICYNLKRQLRLLCASGAPRKKMASCQVPIKPWKFILTGLFREMSKEESCENRTPKRNAVCTAPANAALLLEHPQHPPLVVVLSCGCNTIRQCHNEFPPFPGGFAYPDCLVKWDTAAVYL